jgi:peroxiredoxin
MQCRSHVEQLVQRYPQIKSAGAEVLVILGEGPERTRQYADILHTPFPVLSDPERKVYARFGLDKRFLVIQRTASVVVDRQGVIRYIQRATNPMTWLQDIQGLVALVQGLDKGDLASPVADDE